MDASLYIKECSWLLKVNKSSRGYSYPLGSLEERQKIRQLIKDAGIEIAYPNELDNIDSQSDDRRFYRVFIKHEEDYFTVINHDSRLLPKDICDSLSSKLCAAGIDALVETISHNTKNYSSKKSKKNKNRNETRAKVKQDHRLSFTKPYEPELIQNKSSAYKVVKSKDYPEYEQLKFTL